MSFGNSPHHGGSFVWPRMIARGSAALAACAIAVAGARAADLSGRVAAVNDGRGVPAAEVTLTYAPDTQGPKAITVFTDDSGTFHFPANVEKPGPGSTLQASKLGYRQVSPAALDDGRASVKLLIEPTNNIAASLPASGWLANLPPSVGDADKSH